MTILAIQDNGFVFQPATLYTFSVRVTVRDYTRYVTTPGVSRASLRAAIAAALARDGSTAEVPTLEEETGGVSWFSSSGQINARVNYRPVTGRTIVQVGQTILDGMRSVTPAMTADDAPQPSLIVGGGFVAPWETYRGQVVVPSSVLVGASNAPPATSLAGTVHSDDPARNGNAGIVNSIPPLNNLFGLGVWPAVIGGTALGLVALIAIGYAARGIAQVARET